ncbi:serine hydrolase [Stygiobacter electus]|uniref:Serine hydrolase n=1 Tax=Stygiobacter electus TaxID=3032292 RepID=A0AAE3TCT7_9BACT|nr:serine hydrolase [Stygiobacter electus]MDF1611791.1 serine hydrolase [Stygiobacter electus]
MKNFLLTILFLTCNFNFAQENLIEKLLRQNPQYFSTVLSNIDTFEVQIIYTQINRDKNNYPKFTTYKFNVDPKKYFYPASTVKLPLAVLSLEKINKLKISGLTKFTPLKIDSVREGQTSVTIDTSSVNGLPSIANYVKKVLLVSDNDAYNRLYEFLGQEYINEQLHKKGFKDVKIIHRFVPLSIEQNRYTNPITFYDGEKILYQQPEQYNNKTYSFDLKGLLKGIGYLDSKDSLIKKPFDFSNKNYISLETLHNILKAIIFPETQKNKFNLTNEDYKFLYKYMSMFPRESKKPGYDSTHHDSYVKYFLFGDSKEKIPDNIRIFNKVGLAYGYLIDVAYIVDFKNKVEFMLSAVIHVNKNKIYNDGIYEYEQIGLPFLSKLGKVVYEYELNRNKKFLPDLSKFKIDYTKLD